MIFKHSINSIIRSPKKTIFFSLLLILLTILLCFGAGMYESACNMLLDADKTFTSVVELNYLGDFGDDEVDFYRNMNVEMADFNFGKLENNHYVKTVDKENTAWAFIDGNTIKRSNTLLYNYSIVKVSNIIKYKDNLYMGIVDEILFGNKVRENSYIVINDMDEHGIPKNYNFSEDHEYLIVGKVAKGMSPMLIITPGAPEAIVNISSITDMTENTDFFLSDEGKKFLSLQEAMSVVDNSLQVTMVSSLEASEPYYSDEILLKEGKIFNTSEYQEEKNEVILISEAVADFYHVKIGDKISLKLHYNKNGIGHSDFLRDSKFDYTARYEVIGIFMNKEENKYIIYMPQANWIDQELHSTTLTRYNVKNGNGVNFIEDNKSILLPNMEFTLYDQNYGEAIKPIAAIKNSAVMIIILSSLSGMAILILYSYLFVNKQKDTLRTMLSLGTGKRKTMKYILYGSVIMVLCTSIIGSIIAAGSLTNVTSILYEMMKDAYGTDLRYSERSIGVQMNFEPHFRVNQWIFMIVIIAIFVVSLIYLVSFTYIIIHKEWQFYLRKENKKERVLIPRKNKVKNLILGRVRPITLKFALISLIRSPGRSSIIPLISLIVSLFIVFLGLLSSIQQEKLDSVYDLIPVTAYMTSYNDETRDIGGLDLQYDVYRLIDPEYPCRLEWNMEVYISSDKNSNYTYLNAIDDREKILTNSQYFEEMNLYTAIHYEFMGISITKEGEQNREIYQVPNIRKHNNDFGYDWFLNKINHMPRLAYVDDLRYTPDFFNNSGPEIEFLEGFNYDSFQLSQNIGMISQNFSTTFGIKNGDTIRVTAWYEYAEEAICSVIDLKVIGIYNEIGQANTIYIPWIMSYNHNYYIDFKYPDVNENSGKLVIWNELLPRSVKAATFTLKNTDKLTAIRDYLEVEGYSQVGKFGDKRRAVVIQDKKLVETVQNLNNHIRLIDIIKPIMLILFGNIGFVVSYIIIKHRMNEFAIMRSMGAKKIQVFFSFFLEQLILFFIGLIPSVAYTLILPDKAILYAGSLIYFIFSYLMGTSLTLIFMVRAKLLDILFIKE